MLTNKFLMPSGLLFLSAVLSLPVQGGVEVIKEYPKIYPEKRGEFGNAQNSHFRRSIEGEEPVDADDTEFLDSINIKRPDNRSYFRGRIGRPKMEFKNISNNSGGSSLTIVAPEVDEKLWQLTLAYGYKWHNWATELEVVFSEANHYNANPLYADDPSPKQIRARTKIYGALWNAEYIFGNDMAFMPRRLHPYVNGGIGIGFKKTEASAYNLGSVPLGEGSHRTIDIIYNLGVGFRYDIIGNLLFDVSYRYFDFGECQIGPVAGQTLHVNDMLSKGIFLGLFYGI